MRKVTRFIAAVLCCVLASGCASWRTLADYERGDPVFFSGTRFDVALIRDDPIALKQFHSEPPAAPAIDLPFSFVADLFFWMLSGARSLGFLTSVSR